MSVALYGATVTLSWNANTESDMASYKIYQTNTPGAWGTPLATVSIPATSFDILNVPDGLIYWCISAVDVAGNESAKSDPVNLNINTIAPAKPSGLKAAVKN